MTVEKSKAYKDILIRAGKTFIQAFISSLTIGGVFGVTEFGELRKIALSILVGAVAAGISAVWNSFLEWLTIRIDELDEDDELELTEDELKQIEDELSGGDVDG